MMSTASVVVICVSSLVALVMIGFIVVFSVMLVEASKKVRAEEQRKHELECAVRASMN